MSIRKHDVLPSAANKGLTIRAPFADGPAKRDLEQFVADAKNTTEKHLARLSNYQERDIHVTTPNAGLTLIGPASGDSTNSIALAHNASMAVLEEKIAELSTKLAAVAAALAVLETAKK